MLDIVDNYITLTRGDSANIEVEITVDGEPYTPEYGDTVRFAVKHKTMNADKTAYTDENPLLVKHIPIDTMILALAPADTKNLGFGTYDYDIEITFSDGNVDTFISNTFKLTKEVD